MSLNPSSSTPSTPVRIGNFFSTFDTESIISQLTTARQAPIHQLEAQQTLLSQRSTALTQLTTQFSALLSRVNTLFDSTSVSAKTASVSGYGVQAAAGPNAAPGSYSIAVNKLATTTSTLGSAITAALDATSMLSSSNFRTVVTAGTFTMKAATGAAAITVDPATQSLNDLIAQINAQTGTTGITASLVNDANGLPNILHLDSTMGDIQLGTGADTSNFLSATNLLASPGTSSRESTLAISGLNVLSPMSTASFLGGPPVSGAHSFTINGATINYDATNDSLSTVLARINASNAGVTATYDPVADKISLTQSKPGSIAISLADDGTGGDFLAKTGLLTSAQALGTNAEYSVNGGPVQYAASNTVSLSGGVSLTLTALTIGTPATVTVAQDSSTAISNVNDFVNDYNSLLQSLGDATKADKDSSGPFSGDSAFLSLRSTLRSMVTGSALNPTGRYGDLGSIGLSFGAFGSAVGTTNALQLDADKFKAALANDPVSVQAAFSGLKVDASIAAGSTGSIANMSGSYSGTNPGSYSILDDGVGNLTATFTPNNGGAPVTTTASVTAGSTNTTLIPGMTLTIGALQAGTTTVTAITSSASVLTQLKTFLEGQVGTNGTLAKRQDEFTTVSKDIDTRKAQIQASIDAEMALMRQKFIVMEQAQAQANSVMQTLLQAQNQKSS
ncbi:MAG: flagellar filament capping protein FliD [Tepidiformaceae bacterium]